MESWQRRLIGLGLPCPFALLLNDGLTRHGQPAEYGVRVHSRTTEGAPFDRKLPKTSSPAFLSEAGKSLGRLI